MGTSQDGRKKLKHQRTCDDWNAAQPIGSPVWLTKDSGERVQTKTRSEAYICDAGYPVIFLEGVSGYYLLDRVTRG